MEIGHPIRIPIQFQLNLSLPFYLFLFPTLDLVLDWPEAVWQDHGTDREREAWGGYCGVWRTGRGQRSVHPAHHLLRSQRSHAHRQRRGTTVFNGLLTFHIVLSCSYTVYFLVEANCCCHWVHNTAISWRTIELESIRVKCNGSWKCE